MSGNGLRSIFDGVRIDEEDEFVCPCGFRMRDFLVKKKTSSYYGQQFYTCAKNIQDPTHCKKSIWFDEKERVQSKIPPAMRSPRTPRKQVDIRTFGQYTAPSTLKRKAEAQSFDSGVGDMFDNGIPCSNQGIVQFQHSVIEADSPSVSRSAKRARLGYADVATQTGETATISALAARPAVRAMPRRRLFDEFLTAPEDKPAANSDPCSARTLENDTGSSSIPTSSGHVQHPSPTPNKPMITSNNRTNSVTFSTGQYRRYSPSQTRKLTAPPASSITTGLFTPPSGKHPQHPHPTPESSDPKAPPRSNHKPNSQSQASSGNADSDNETYGWDEDLEQNILEVMDRVSVHYSFDAHSQFYTSAYPL